MVSVDFVLVLVRVVGVVLEEVQKQDGLLVEVVLVIDALEDELVAHPLVTEVELELAGQLLEDEEGFDDDVLVFLGEFAALVFDLRLLFHNHLDDAAVLVEDFLLAEDQHEGLLDLAVDGVEVLALEEQVYDVLQAEVGAFPALGRFVCVATQQQVDLQEAQGVVDLSLLGGHVGIEVHRVT